MIISKQARPLLYQLMSLCSLLSVLWLSGCDIPGVYVTCDLNDGESCADNLICHQQDTSAEGYCAGPCDGDEACSSDGTLLCDAGQCRHRSFVPSDDPNNELPAEVECADNEIACVNRCVAAAIVDGELTPSSQQHCGSCGVAATGLCVNGVNVACNNSENSCPTLTGGTQECTDGACVLTCDIGFEQCSPGECVSIESTENCGACGNDVSAGANECRGGLASCGGRSPCSNDAGLTCIESLDGLGAFCAQCTNDSECGSNEWCCGGTCFAESERVNHCGCLAIPESISTSASNTLMLDSGEDCSLLTRNNACVVNDGEMFCGCDNNDNVTRLEQCSTNANGLVDVCDENIKQCVPMNGSNCGLVNGVTTLSLDEGMSMLIFDEVSASDASGTLLSCSVAMGGPECVSQGTNTNLNAELDAFCGCSDANLSSSESACNQPVLDERGIPHRISNICVSENDALGRDYGIGNRCACAANGAQLNLPCASNEECTDQGCFDLSVDSANCGIIGKECDMGKSCSNYGCQNCIDNTQCSTNAPDCLAFNGDNKCVCENFTMPNPDPNGPRITTGCPMGLSCSSSGCLVDATPYSTLESLNAALGL